jgi:hypothetical protein
MTTTDQLKRAEKEMTHKENTYSTNVTDFERQHNEVLIQNKVLQQKMAEMQSVIDANREKADKFNAM